MAVVGLIGSGNIGGTVARLAVAAGYEVVLSNSRGPETLAGLVAELGPLASAGTPVEAAQRGELVLVSIPLRAYREVPTQPVAGKVVMDTNNYYPQRDGHIAELDDGSTTGSELLQQHLPDAHVVKVFNNINYRHLGSLARPRGAGNRSALFIAGDDAGAKQAVSTFLDNIGYDAVDAGPLGAGGRIFQVGGAGYGTLYGSIRHEHGEPTDAAELRELLDHVAR
jgi:predicted dinucleotide-binding enzyme